MRILVTGAAGFIGHAVCERLLARGDEVLGFDNLNPYYDIGLKRARRDRLRMHRGFEFRMGSLEDRGQLGVAFAEFEPERVINLAAQAGVRYSLQAPRSYIDSNVVGFLNVLECCRNAGIQHLVYASSSSVYGGNTKFPFSESDRVDHPLSLYAATKKANELMAHTYGHLFGLPSTGLRFFTVYGPWGRPDMALFKFTRAILAGEPVELYNNGNCTRDFTFIDDIADGVVRVLDSVPSAPRVLNIGNGQPVELRRYVELIEEALGRKAQIRLAPAQPGDVPDTLADVGELERVTGFRPRIGVEEGVRAFVDWYVDFYGSELRAVA